MRLRLEIELINLQCRCDRSINEEIYMNTQASYRISHRIIIILLPICIGITALEWFKKTCT